MSISKLVQESNNFKTLEMPDLYQDVNVLLAQLIGWEHLYVESELDLVLVAQGSEKPQEFNFLDKKVIFPIAAKYQKEALKISETEWKCDFQTKDKKQMVIISQSQETALALALVLENCV